MIRRLQAIVRDAWWLLLMILAMSVFFWVKLTPLIGLTMIIAGFSVSAYFAILRYDDEGNEKPM